MGTAAQYGMPSEREVWPPVGQVVATCTSAEKWTAPKKGTAAVKLFFDTPDGECHFSDLVFVTIRAISRLNMVAQRLCGLSADTPVPDTPKEAAGFFAKYIMEHSASKQAILTVVEEPYTVMDDKGNSINKTKKKIAFAGYDRYESSRTQPAQADAQASPPQAEDDTIPF